jgi:DNA-binding NtrC family response regulator
MATRGLLSCVDTPSATVASNRTLTTGPSNGCDWPAASVERTNLIRPSFIVAEPEPEQALSSRKLLLETFKFNVITAHSAEETVEMVKLFPNSNALIVHCRLPEFDAEKAVAAVKKNAPKMPIIALCPTERELKWADYIVQSHHPQELLDLVHRLFGDPREQFSDAQ